MSARVATTHIVRLFFNSLQMLSHSLHRFRILDCGPGTNLEAAKEDGCVTVREGSTVTSFPLHLIERIEAKVAYEARPGLKGAK